MIVLIFQNVDRFEIFQNDDRFEIVKLSDFKTSNVFCSPRKSNLTGGLRESQNFDYIDWNFSGFL